jgi:hypothetical protein
MSKENWDDKDFVIEQMTAIQQDGRALEYASARLRNDKAVVLAAIIKNGAALIFASDRLKDDEAVVLAAVSHYGPALQDASDRLKNDKDVVLAAVKQDGRSLAYASDRLKDDNDIVFDSVQRNGWTLVSASDRLKDNEAIVLAAVSNDGYALIYASDRLRGDLNFCIKCLEVSTVNCLSCFTGKANDIDDKKLMLTLLETDTNLFFIASDRLKDDKDIVMAALNNAGGHSILSLASERLRNDKDVILNAFKNDIHSVSKASVLLRSDPSFWLELTDLFQKIEHPYDNFNNTPVKEISYDAMIGEAKTLFSTHHFNIDSVRNHLKNEQLLMKKNNDLINKLKNEIPLPKKDLFKRRF